MVTSSIAHCISSTLAAVLGLPLLSETHIPALVDFLRAKQMLIVLDNCEHVVGAAAELAEALLKGAAQIHVLTTSREPLQAEGEWLRRLPALESPPETDVPITKSRALAFPAIQLFAERAKASVDSLELTDAEAPVLVKLCHRLDGIPLAIELAAARVDAFGVAGLAAQIDNCLSLLTKGRRTAQARHRTLRATLDWSFELLPEVEQVLMVRMGVFNTRFSPEAAIAVAAGGALTPESILDGLANLSAKSLIVSSLAGGRVSYRLLDTTRAYAIEKLGDGETAASVRRRHAEHFRNMVKRLEARSQDQETNLFEECRLIVDEIRSALDWTFSPAGDALLGLELAVASSFAWYQLSLLDEYRAHAERALDRIKAVAEPPREVEMRLLGATGSAIYNTKGSVPAVAAAFSRALELAEQINDLPGQLWALFGLWQYHHGLGLYSKSLALTEEYGRRAGTSNDPTLLLSRIKGITHLYRGEFAQARECVDYVLRHPEKLTRSGRGAYDYDQLVVTLMVRARLLWLQGLPSQARRAAETCVEEGIASKHSLSVCFALALAGCPVAIWTGELSIARKRLQLLEERSAALGLLHWHGYAEILGRAINPEARAVTQWNYRHSEEFSVLGEGFASEDLIARSKCEIPIWCTAEILRLEATRALRQKGSAALDEVNALLSRSLEIARQQGALSWELRTAKSLAEIWRARGRSREGYELLRSTVDRFTEGFETADLIQAQTLLSEMQAA